MPVAHCNRGHPTRRAARRKSLPRSRQAPRCRRDSAVPVARWIGAVGYRERGHGNCDGASAGKQSHMVTLRVNGTTREVDAEPNTPLLWVLRDDLRLTGTKFGCGVAQCGACTVHIDGQAVRSCSMPISMVEGKKITTIEGLADNGVLHRVQQAWVDLDVPQCGYCQSGMIMAVAALLIEKPKPTDAEIDAAITNICRCGTFPQVRAGIHRAAASA
jgi:isoquinoline 1-oxidoreductase subunit alpha